MDSSATDFVDQVFVAVKEYCNAEFDRRLAAAVAVLEQRISDMAGKDGRDGTDGKDGAPGRDGVDGIAGKDGAPGRDGIDARDPVDGKDGAPGADGLHGKDGAPGLDGRDGRDGQDGAPGRDALQLDIIPAIDEQRCYRRGTYARHAGGLVRAFRNTDPLPVGAKGLEKAGWEVVVFGLQQIVTELLKDERTSVVYFIDTDGAQVEHRFYQPAMIFRGAFKKGETYQRGDTVSFGGSTWHCDAWESSTAPKESDDWTLANKCGRDGRDGKDGAPGERGLQGEPGRDWQQLEIDRRRP